MPDAISPVFSNEFQTHVPGRNIIRHNSHALQQFSPLHSVLINKRFHQLPPSSPSFFLSYSLLFQLIKIISYPAIYDKFLLVKNRKTPAALRRRGLLRLSTSIFRYNYILFPQCFPRFRFAPSRSGCRPINSPTNALV